MKNLLIVSHCILNNAAKVEQDEAELAEEYKIREELMQLILKKDVQLLQLPCPEFIMYGSQRWGHVKNQFQHPFYMEQCRKILEPVLLQLQEYAQHVEKFHVLGIVSVEGSPNCGYHLTCEGEWKGEIGTDEKRIQDIQKSLKMTENPGVYMEVLEKELQKRNMEIPIVTMKEAVQLLNNKRLERKEENKMKNRKVYVTTFCGVAVAMNIVLGIITSALGIPLYLDTLGTVLSAAILGPVPGIIVGALSNIITGLIYSVSDIPFCLVNMAVGLIVGLVAKKWKFGIVPAVITGIALSFICPAIGTPIGIYVYGGLNGSVSDMLVMSLVQGGKTIFQASFLRNVASNLIDKIGTCIIGCLLIKAMPMRFMDNFKKEA